MLKTTCSNLLTDLNILSSVDEANQKHTKQIWIFTYDSSFKFSTERRLLLLVTIICLAYVLAYVISAIDGGCEACFFRGLLDGDHAQWHVVIQQGVVYRQGASAWVTEDLKGPSEDHPAKHRDLWSGDKNWRGEREKQSGGLSYESITSTLFMHGICNLTWMIPVTQTSWKPSSQLHSAIITEKATTLPCYLASCALAGSNVNFII